MKQLPRVCGLLLLFGTALLSQSSTDAQLKELYDHHRWFELREATRGQKRVPPLYMGAVASAFNEVELAERFLTQAIRDAPDSKSATDPREQLGILYVRVGRLRDAVRQFDLLLQATPGRTDVQNFRAMLTAFNVHGDARVVSNRRATFKCTLGPRGLFIPASVNGIPVHWSLDTGFNESGLSEAEARMLGLTIEAGGSVRDMAGTTTIARTAVAQTIIIGETEYKNVPLLVLSDSAPLVSRLPPGMRGAVGLPVALGLQMFRWSADGECETGRSNPLTKNAVSNLAFDGLKMVTRVQFESNLLDFVLDTGNQSGTQLWASFARDYPALLRDGRSGVKGLSEIGGSADRQVVILPEIRLGVGGLLTTLRPANVFSRPVGDNVHYGNLGLDLLGRGREMVIDFQSLSLALR